MALAAGADRARAAADSDGFVVIVHADNPAAALRRSQLSDIFLGRQTSWPDGSAVVPVEQSGRSALRARFCEDVHGRSIGAVQAYWEQAMMSGRGTPPRAKSGDAEVIAHVRAEAGGLGYVSVGAALGQGVKVLRIEK